MALRVFIDRAGTEWQVWDCRVEGRSDWLCFESTAEKRRLSPAPAGWENASEDRLYLLCRMATPSPKAADPLRSEAA